MDLYTTSFCLPRYAQLQDAAIPSDEPATSSARQRGASPSQASAHPDAPPSPTSVTHGPDSKADFRDDNPDGVEMVPETASSIASSSSGSKTQRLAQELQAGFSSLTAEASSRFQCAINMNTVHLVQPIAPVISTHPTTRDSMDGFSVASESNTPPQSASFPPRPTSAHRATPTADQTGALNQLVVLPNQEAFHFNISGGYQQVLGARGAILRDAPFKRKCTVKVPRSEIVDGTENVKADLRKKLDEIAALTKAHLAILGPSKETESTATTSHGLETDKNVDVVVTGPYESVEQAKVRLLVLLDELSGLHSEVCEIDYKLHNIIAGRKRSVVQTIQEETGTNIYFPSPLSGVLGGKNPTAVAKQNLIFITGEFFGVQRARDMLYQVSTHKSKCIISRDTAILPRKLDWMLTERSEEVKAAMNDNGTFVNFPVIGSQASMISVFGDHRVNIERTIRSIMGLACQFYIASFWLLPASFDVFMPPPSISPSQVPDILKKIAVQTGVEAVFKSNCFELHGQETEVRAAVALVSSLEQVKAFHHEIRFQLELANEHREFISGKKNGKLNKVMKSANVKIKFETFNDYNFLIDIAGSDDGALEGLTMLQEELPSEISFHVPESYHKRIIGVGGKNIQRIMKRYGVYVKFSNAEEFAALGGYIDNDDNVVARTPAKNAANLEHLKASVMELVNPREKDFITETVTIPRRYHRTLLGEKAIFLHDIEHKTNSSFRFPNKESASDTITIFGPESQIHIAAQMLLVHIPFEADFKVPNSEELKAAAASSEFQQLIDRLKHELNIVVLPLLKPEAKESIFRFCLNRGNLDFLPAARDGLEDFLVSKKVELPPGSTRPKSDRKHTDSFKHFNSALFSTTSRAPASVPPSPADPKGNFSAKPSNSNYEPESAMPPYPHNQSQAGFYGQLNQPVHSPRPVAQHQPQHSGYPGGGSGYYRPSPDFLSHSHSASPIPPSHGHYDYPPSHGYYSGVPEYHGDGYSSPAPYGMGQGHHGHHGHHQQHPGSYSGGYHDDYSSRGHYPSNSDPAVFSHYLWDSGVKGLQVEEVLALDPALLENLEPIYALIFLFKWRDASAAAPTGGEASPPAQKHFFAQQVAQNACATLALLNSVLNIPLDHPKQLGQTLTDLKDFCADMDYETNGHVIVNSDQLRAIHNSFARSDPFALDELQEDSGDREDAFHFIAYLPIGDALYELDGLKPLPINHGTIPAGSSWVSLASSVLQHRISTYAAHEVHFNLMAIVGDRLQVLQAEIAQTEAAAGSVADESARADAYTRLAQLQSDVKDELDKRQRWELEIKLKRHNFTGFSVQLLIELAKRGQLEGQVEAAREKMQARRAAAGAA